MESFLNGIVMKKTSKSMEIKKIEYADESILIAIFGFFGLPGFWGNDKKN